jgi:outer membrane biogenesis lipoprotein LolB
MMKKVLAILMAIAVLLTTSCAVLSPKEHNEENTETFLFPGE